MFNKLAASHCNINSVAVIITVIIRAMEKTNHLKWLRSLSNQRLGYHPQETSSVPCVPCVSNKTRNVPCMTRLSRENSSRSDCIGNDSTVLSMFSDRL